MLFRVTPLVLAASLAFAAAPFAALAQSTEAAQPAEAGATILHFESEAQVETLAAEGATVVFFFAPWCPNCRVTLLDLNARWSEVNPDLTLVIADYDGETELKARYGVTYQDTFVLLDAQGDAVRTWNGGGVGGLNRNTQS